MGALETTAVVVTIVVAIFNIAWTLWSQRRDRAQRQAERAEDQVKRQSERAEDQAQRQTERVEDRERWVASGHVVSLQVIQFFAADETQWAQVEVRNTGRGPCTVDEVGSWYSPSGPGYGYYTSDPESGYELERDSTPLPYVLEGGRKGVWFLDLRVLRSTARDAEHGASLHIYVELQNSERHTIPFPISPSQ